MRTERSSRRCACLALVLALLAGPTVAIAQPETSRGIVPPRLEEALVLPYPDDAPRGEGSVEVVIRLAIDDSGGYVAADIARSGGQPFDDLALDAARQLRLAPALIDGVPTAVTVELPVRFVLPPPRPAPPPSGVLVGVVREAGSRKALPDIELAVRLHGDEDAAPIIQITTDANGGFSFVAVPEGTWDVVATGPGVERAVFTEEVVPGLLRQVTYKLRPVETSQRTVVRVRRSRADAERIVDGEWVRASAGSSGGFLRVLESEPSIAPTPILPTGLFPGAPIIRGAEGSDSVVLVDGVETPLLYHFGLLTTVVSEDTIDHLELYPSGTGAEHGDHIGGAVDVSLRSPRTDRFGGYIDVSPIDATVLLEAPIGQPVGLYASYRRSYLDAYLGKLLPKDLPAEVTAMPVYTDLTALLEIAPGGGHRIVVSGISSHDGMSAVRTDEDDGSQATLASVEAGFTLLHAFWNSPVDRPAEGHASVAYENALSTYSAFPDLYIDVREQRTELSGGAGIRVGPGVRIRYGFDVRHRIISYGEHFFALPREDEPGLINPYAMSPSEQVVNLPMIEAGVYAAAPMHPSPRLVLTPGIRVDQWSLSARPTVDPRISARVKAHQNLALRISTGLFHQVPSMEDMAENGARLGLVPEGAWQTSAGALFEPIPAVDLTVDLYYRRMWNLVVADSSLYDEVLQGSLASGESGRDLSNSGIGQALGAEMTLRWTPVTQVDVLLAYSLSRSERRDHQDEQWRLYQYDRPHQLTFAAQAKLPKEWSVGLRFRLASGAPDTPLRDSLYLADLGGWVPRWGLPYSERMRPYHQLDWRIQKVLRPKFLLVLVYLDVENTYYAKRDDVVVFNRTFSERLSFAMVPLFRLGLRAEF